MRLKRQAEKQAKCSNFNKEYIKQAQVPGHANTTDSTSTTLITIGRKKGRKQSAKLKTISPTFLEKRRKYEREKKRRQRAKMSAEMFEKKREYDRKYRERKRQEGSLKRISEMTPRKQRQQRKDWRIRAKKSRENRKMAKKMQEPVLQNLPPSSKKQCMEKTKLQAELTALRHKVKVLEGRTARYKKRLQRLKNGTIPTPEKNAKHLISKDKVPIAVERRLLFGEVLIGALKKQSEELGRKHKEKQKIARLICSKYFRKYHPFQETGGLVSYRQYKQSYRHVQRKPYQSIGKSVAATDGVGGVLKRSADKSVSQGKEITSAKTFVELSQHNCGGVETYLIASEDITFMQGQVPTEVMKIPKMMKVHQATWCSLASETIQLRALSCFECSPATRCEHHHLSEVSMVVHSNIQIHDNQSSSFPSSSPVKAAKSNSPEDIKEGEWVAVVWDNNWYPGLVEYYDRTAGSIITTFMARNGTKFYWPTKPDVQVLDPSTILYKIVEPPTPITTRYFVLANAEQKHIDYLYSLVAA